MRSSLPVPLALALVLTSCPGDDGDPLVPGFSGVVDAGADFDAVGSERVRIVPTLDGAIPEWIQLAGPPVELLAGLGGDVTFDAPDFPSVVDLRLRGRVGGEVVAIDDVRVTVRGGRRLVDFELAARVDLGGAPLRALASDQATRETFVVRGNEVVGFDLTDATAPVPLGTLAPSASAPGEVRDVAVGGGLVAVTHDGTPGFAPGRLVLYSATTLAELASIEVPPRPVEVVYAPFFNDPRFAIACAADPQPDGSGGIADGRGAVLLVTVPPSGAGSLDPMNDVVEVDFRSLNGEAEALRTAGVRLPRAGDPVSVVLVAEDLEPRSIDLLANGTVATVALPANGAVARVDFATGEVLAVRGLPRADFGGDGFP
ncbi:MAG: hypothetical protein AAGB93_11120, partial [Planctomycetota bacterium]